MNFQLTLAARYLGGRKLRTFLTTLAIVIGVMVIFGMGIYLPSFMDAFQQEPSLGVRSNRCDDYAQDRRILLCVHAEQNQNHRRDCRHRRVA